MEEIIEPISKELLKAELTEEKRLRMTNKSHNQIYIITAQDSPNIMKEIGRLREIAVQQAEVQGNRLISMSTISWKVPTNS